MKNFEFIEIYHPPHLSRMKSCNRAILQIAFDRLIRSRTYLIGFLSLSHIDQHCCWRWCFFTKHCWFIVPADVASEQLNVTTARRGAASARTAVWAHLRGSIYLVGFLFLSHIDQHCCWRWCFFTKYFHFKKIKIIEPSIFIWHVSLLTK